MQPWFLYVSLILLGFPARVTGFREKIYVLYACPLSLSLESYKALSRRGIRYNSRTYAPYGLNHTYIAIKSTCYDWGTWNYPRRINCMDEALCDQNRTAITFGFTTCAHRISEFECAWRNVGRDFDWNSWNCQVYTDKMKEFLESCDATSLF
ncbi:uncharacterized protein LOC132729853 [Ruditapes philippinarum]|uniref:uncharacterized protein LOC132729853 n=1 Tax=Ruditapes philippinarum TaxID=129788 RepID=UPI00295AAA0E|nr:uncharacterized protein LOC132729853 [Ruditapes philippinarum]